ncbi:disease resistance protein RPV1-like [Quercus robur]|uniref:disease resistance protein RPV1-like n=1 Tax=Quercus robur TaxID=38942 RepID=UPI002162F71E|nr:disease resistance protein RPV1-like [Quercus robur]
MEDHNNEDDAISSYEVSRLRWHVFLSFRGEDTRYPFINNLYTSLHNKGIRAFRDDDGLRRGDEIAPTLLDAIEESAASIVIISQNYADSRWCLEELSKICECKRLILPVFYQVDPSDVRKQRGPFFGKHFREHEEKGIEKEKVMKWRKAMETAGGKAGFVFKDKDIDSNEEQAKLIQRLVKRVLEELNSTPLNVAPYTVGLESRIEELMSLLDVRSNGVQVLGLYGVGGVGKTTLAKALHNKLVGSFQYLVFMKNNRENSEEDEDLVYLQNKLINHISPGKPPVYEVSSGISAIKDEVYEKRVLIIMDDIHNVRQLEVLIGGRDWFSEGSRIIITTRNRDVLPDHLVNGFYEVRELAFTEALQLFSHHALRREKPTERFMNLSKQMVSLTGGLPLALEVFGSFLFERWRIEEWKDALQKLKRIRPRNLQDVLKISYDGLDVQEQRIFLDIACLFIKMEIKREDILDALKGCGFRAEIAVTVLRARSLIKIFEDNSLWMHDQIRDMGRQIVLDESPVDPGMRSRLWDRDEIMSVLKGEKGTRCIEGIVLDFEGRPIVQDPSGERISRENLQRRPNLTSALTYMKEWCKKFLQNNAENERKVVLHTKPFESMVNLRLLQINHVRLEGKYKYLPAGLKWLQWKECPLKTLPSEFFPRELAVLDLSRSGIEKVWGSCTSKVAENLMVMNLSRCYNLAAIPDLSGNHALEKLILVGCKKLTKIHESLGNMSTLLHLNLRECSKLIKFPTDISGLQNLEILVLSDCSKLKELPMNIGSMKSLKELLVDNTAIAKLPESIFRLTKLEKIDLNHCQLLRRLPNCIGKLSSLKELSLNNSAIEEIPDSVGSLSNLEILSLMWCGSLTAIPDSVGSLISLTQLLLNGSAIKELPISIGSLSYLKELSVGNCKDLDKLPDSIEELASMVELQLDGTPITYLPDQVGALKMLRKLEMRNCKKLRFLPESIGSLLALTTLNLFGANISELPESIGMLENLILLRLNKCTQLCKLPSSIGNLKSLHHLWMEETAVIELPESFGMLSSLMILKMAKKPYIELSGNSVPNSIEFPTSFSNLCSLVELNARAWKLCGKIPDDFEKLSSLESLNLGYNNFFSLPSSLTGLFNLKELLLPYCKELKSLPPLPSNLEVVNVANCTALESVSDLSNLERLQELNLANCEKVVDIPGLECLKSLTRLHMCGCKACSSMVKRRLSKVCLRNIRTLSMPGSRIPGWFQEGVRFSERKNLKIKGVIICVVVSLDHQIPDDLRDQLPIIAGIDAILVKMNKPLFSTMLKLEGVPKTHEDHLYLCRFPDCHPIVSKLKDGYEINVIERDPPMIKGLKLKRSGIYLVFEGDDDYEGDEESLDESQLSISEKLSKFFSCLEEEDHTSQSDCVVESQVQAIEEEEEEREISEPVWWDFLRPLQRCFCL